MVRRSNYSVDNSPKRDEHGRVVSHPKKKHFMRTPGFIFPLLGVLMVIILALAMRGLSG